MAHSIAGLARQCLLLRYFRRRSDCHVNRLHSNRSRFQPQTIACQAPCRHTPRVFPMRVRLVGDRVFRLSIPFRLHAGSSGRHKRPLPRARHTIPQFLQRPSLSPLYLRIQPLHRRHDPDRMPVPRSVPGNETDECRNVLNPFINPQSCC